MFNSILFADDTSLFHAGKNPVNIVKEINDEIPNIISWLNANKLSLNLEKTNFILFSPKNAPKLNTDLLINHTKITEVNQTNFLGVIIDNNLNWSAHIRYIQNKIAKGIGIITKARKVFDYETLLSLYNSLIYPYITYCIHAWGNAFPAHIKPIVLLQKKAVRIINGIPPSLVCEKRIFKGENGCYCSIQMQVFINIWDCLIWQDRQNCRLHPTDNARLKQVEDEFGSMWRASGNKTGSGGVCCHMHECAYETGSQIPQLNSLGIWCTVCTSPSALRQQTPTDRS